MSQTTELIQRLIARGLSQIEIARRTGIPQPRLSRWQKGETPDAADDALTLQQLEAELITAEQMAPSLSKAEAA